MENGALENEKLMQKTPEQDPLDWFVREPATDDPENLSLEIIFNFVDKNGNRTRPQCNRITVKLQVNEITQTESVMFPMWLQGSICFCFQRHEFLHRWLLDPKRVKKLEELSNSGFHKFFGLAYTPQLDCIESLNIQHISRCDGPISHHKSQSDQLPDISTQSHLVDSKT